MNEDQIEGKAKQAEGKGQETWGDAKDKVEDVVEDAKEKADDLKDKASDALDRDEDKDKAGQGTRTFGPPRPVLGNGEATVSLEADLRPRSRRPIHRDRGIAARRARSCRRGRGRRAELRHDLTSCVTECGGVYLSAISGGARLRDSVRICL